MIVPTKEPCWVGDEYATILFPLFITVITQPAESVKEEYKDTTGSFILNKISSLEYLYSLPGEEIKIKPIFLIFNALYTSKG